MLVWTLLGSWLFSNLLDLLERYFASFALTVVLLGGFFGVGGVNFSLESGLSFGQFALLDSILD